MKPKTFHKAKPEYLPQPTRPDFDIIPMNRKQRRLFHHWKLKLSLAFFVIICFTVLGIIGTMQIATWFDGNKMVFQNPLLFALRQPILISQRFPISPVPKATYIQVSPLTSTQEIVDAAKHGTIPQYAASGNLLPISRDVIRALIHNKVVQKWGEAAWPEIDYVITRESDYNPYIVNKSSGATGIFQALPATKLPSLDITDQINWGINYIEQRYKTPANAKSHEQALNWY